MSQSEMKPVQSEVKNSTENLPKQPSINEINTRIKVLEDKASKKNSSKIPLYFANLFIIANLIGIIYLRNAPLTTILFFIFILNSLTQMAIDKYEGLGKGNLSMTARGLATFVAILVYLAR